MSRGQKMAEQGVKTRKRILEQGIKMWLKDPSSVTANGIAKAMKPATTHMGVIYHFPNVRDSVAEHAVEIGCAEIIVQLIVEKHPAVKKLSAAERAKYLRTV